MVPSPSLLPQVLPAGELGATGRPTGDLRTRLYRIPNARNAFHLASLWAQTGATLTVAVRWQHPLVWVIVFVLQGRTFARFSILTHEAAHRLLFTSRRWNDFAGRWLLGYPALLPMDAYRRGHMAHHKEEFGANEPDLALYEGYPITKASWRRKLVRDAVGISGYKNLKLLVLATKLKVARGAGTGMMLWQLAIVGIGFALHIPLLWPLLWLAPWMTVWRVFNRLRAVAEHGGMHASPDRRQTTHVIHQSFWSRFWIVPYNTGWHLAHHTDIGIPWVHLPRFHEELVSVGWVIPALEHRSYRAFWKAATRT
ncbi:MAG: fatty acid desaturase [Acidimicrobiia bacterium]